jgi:hypothetical protein
MTTNTDVLVRRTTTILSGVLLCTVCATAAMVFWPASRPSAESAAAATAPAYRAGESIDTPAAWHESSSHTLVLFAQAACGACQNAQPYLKSLVAHLEGRAAIVLATPGPRREVELEYAAAIGIPESAVHASPRTARARVTPTLVVVDRTGRILAAWEGVGPEDRHDALTRAIDGAIASMPAPTPPATQPAPPTPPARP